MPRSNELPTPEALRRLALEGVVDAGTLERSLELIGFLPDGPARLRVIDRVLLALGTALVLAGIVAFFAFNWDGLAPRFKFALIETGIVAGVVAGWRWWGRPAGHVGGVAASVLVGVLLGVIGQVYPTGAPWYYLFGLWLLLVLGWAVSTRFAGNAVLAITLANATWIAFCTDVLFGQEHTLVVSGTVVLNAAALAFLEWRRARGADWLSPAWATRVVGLAVLLGGAMGAIDIIFDGFGGGWAAGLAPASFLVSTMGMGWFYRFERMDLMILAAVFLAWIAVGAAAIVRVTDASFWGFLLAGVAVLGSSAVAAGWLRRQTQPEGLP